MQHLIGRMVKHAKAGAADEVDEESGNFGQSGGDGRGKRKSGQRKDSGMRNKVKEERRDNSQRNRGL